MAIELRFSCSQDSKDYLSVKADKYERELINVYGVERDRNVLYTFDISTAIKFAKTLRTEINKAKKEGGSNE